MQTSGAEMANGERDMIRYAGFAGGKRDQSPATDQ